MELRIVTPEMRDALRAPLDQKAVSQHPTKTFLSSIKSIYITERLNEVFGVGSWQIENKIIDNSSAMIVVETTLSIPLYGIKLSSFGGNNNGGENSKNFDLGDAYKGAVSDAISKIGSWLEIGIDVFKGLQTSKVTPKQQTTQSAIQPSKSFDLDDRKKAALSKFQELKTDWKICDAAIKMQVMADDKFKGHKREFANLEQFVAESDIALIGSVYQSLVK